MLKTSMFSSLGKRLAASALALSLVLMGSSVPALAVAQSASQRQQLFTKAAQEFNVPEAVLLAVSYNQSRWETHGTAASVDGGYGLMNLTSPQAPSDAKGTGQTPKVSGTSRHYTLDKAAQLLHEIADQLRQNDEQNVRGAAAVLAQYAKDTHGGTLPTNLADWYGAVSQYASAATSTGAADFADAVFNTIKTGVSTTTSDGQAMSLPATNVTPNKPAALNQTFRSQQTTNNGAECPNDLNCRFVPAGYAQNSADPADYGNYDHANRPKDMDIKYIVIHDTEGSYQSAIDHFQDTTSYVSCNYVIRSSDGAVTQMVRNQDVGWCAGDWYVNMHSINIEHEGFAANGKAWYTEAMYASSAKLVRYLAKKYNIPLDRQHIIGHDNIPTTNPLSMPNQHWDPGPYWDWNHYMALLHGVSDKQEAAQNTANTFTMGGGAKVVTISPNFETNKQTFTDCSTTPCATLPTQGSSAVFIRTKPEATAPLLSDMYVHSDGSAGTNRIDDWGSVAAAGQKFAYAGQQGDWIAIWYGGQKGWIYNPSDNPSATIHRGAVVKPKLDKPTVEVYGVAYPEADAYPSDNTVPAQTLKPLYTMKAGQAYTVSKGKVPTDYFYDATINSSLPHDHEVIVGKQKFYQILFNHRIAYVKASDVTIQR